MSDTWRQTLVSELELSVRAYRTLQNKGIENQGQLYDYFTTKSKKQVLQEIRGFGVKTYYEVMTIVNEIRRALRGEEPGQRPELPIPWYKKLEPEAVEVDHDSVNQFLLHSIAISTKRIADALSGENVAELFSQIMQQPTNKYGEGLMEGIQGSIRRGQQGIE